MRSLVSKMMLALGAILVVTVVILGTISFIQLRRAEMDQLTRQALSLQGAFLSEVSEAATAALVGATTLGSMPEVVDALEVRDRERLMEVALPIFHEVQERGISQAQFHLPPATSFLRLHHPDTFGDDLSAIRATVLQANQTHRSVSGLEEGVFGWGIRSVVPVARDGRHLGTVEYGLEFGSAFLQRLREGRTGEYFLYALPGAEGAERSPFPFAATIHAPSALPSPGLIEQVASGGGPLWERSGDLLLILVPIQDFQRQTKGYLLGLEPVQIAQDNGQLLFLYAMLLVTLLILAVTWYMLRWSLAPLKRLADRLSSMAEGDLSGPELAVTSVDEVGVITAAFNRMSRGLRARYQAMVDHAGEIVLFTRPSDGQILEANQAAAKAHGYTREELTQMNIRDLRSAVHRPLIPEQLHRAWESSQGMVFETMHRRKDGTAFPVEVYAYGIEVDGEPLLVSLVRDITRYKERERISELATEMNHRILQNDPKDQVLGSICDGLAALYQADLVWIGLKESPGTISPKAVRGWGSILLANQFLRWDQPPERSGPSGLAIQTGQVQTGRVSDLKGIPGLAHYENLLYLAVPLLVQQEAIGALTILHHLQSGFRVDQLIDLQVFASQIALSILTADVQADSHLRTVALEAAANAIVIVNRDGSIKWANPAFARMTGYTMEEVTGRNPRILKSGMQSEAFYTAMWETILAGQVWRGELQNRRKNGDLYTEEMTITPVLTAGGEVGHFIAVKQDITDRKRQEEQLRESAIRDPLTGLPNRRAFEDYLTAAVSRAQRGSPAVLLVADVDHFGLINDTLGYPVGDYVLCEIARQLQALMRPGDLLARIGPDGFGILASELDREAAVQLADRVREAVAACAAGAQEHHVEISVSVGGILVDGVNDAEDLLICAQEAVNAARTHGRNHAVFYFDEVKVTGSTTGNRMALYLTDAIHLGLLTVHYQPVVSLATSQPEHYEALIRLPGPEGNLLPPSTFLPVAEQYRLMPALDRWVVREVLTQLQRRPDLRCFVNLSGQTLGETESLQEIEALIQGYEAGVAVRLTFEITETTAVRDLPMAQAWMQRLTESGCRFALDDFGTGFSSFHYLRVLPVSYVKIDGSFIRNLHEDAASRAMVKAITTVAHTLGKMVVAEWVENHQVLPILRGLGVEYGQGYGLGRPAPLDP